MIADLLIAGIARTIAEQFGDAYSIYADHVEQGFSKPCFYIKILNSERQDYIGSRHKRRYLLDIHYFPKDGAHNQNQIAGVFYNVLKILKVTDEIALLGKSMHTEIEDGVLHFFVTYDWIVQEFEAISVMEELQQEIGVK